MCSASRTARQKQVGAGKGDGDGDILTQHHFLWGEQLVRTQKLIFCM